LKLLVLLFANAATVTPQSIENGIALCGPTLFLDSAVTVSCYNMWSPLRARRINAQGLLDPFVPFETFGDPKTMNCDRDSQGDVWFADMGVSIVRPYCLDQLEAGLLPQKWMGQKIHPIKQWGGLDVDEPWQIPAVENWISGPRDLINCLKPNAHNGRITTSPKKTALSLLRLDKWSRFWTSAATPAGWVWPSRKDLA